MSKRLVTLAEVAITSSLPYQLTPDGREWVMEDKTHVPRIAGGALLNTPIPPEWSKYLTQQAGKLEVIPDQLYDAVNYDVSATPTQLQFFDDVRANLGLSNMTQPGFLPNPQSFLIEAIRIFFRTQVETADQGAAGNLASQMNDIALLLNTGRITFTIGSKNYGPWRLWTMPANSGLSVGVAAAGAEAANLVSGYGQTRGREWGLFPHLAILPMQNFSGLMTWPTTVTTSADIVVEVLFDGKRARAVQ